MDGTEFRKLTHELHGFYDSKVIRGEKRIYFNTLEDIDKNGKSDSNDNFHYYYIDFSNEGFTLNEYAPLKTFK